MKTKATELSKELGVSFDSVMVTIKDRVQAAHVTGHGKNTWLTDEGVDTVMLAYEMPEATPKVHKARVKETPAIRILSWLSLRAWRANTP